MIISTTNMILKFMLQVLLTCTMLSEVHGGHLVERMSMKERWTKHTGATTYRAGHLQGHPEHIKKMEDPVMLQNGSLESDMNDSGEEVKFVKEIELVNDTDDSRTVEFVNDEEWNKGGGDGSSIIVKDLKSAEANAADSAQNEIGRLSVGSGEGLYRGKSRHYDDLNRNIGQGKNSVFNIEIKTDQPVFITDDHFISYTLDYAFLTSSDPWLMFNISSPRMITLVKGLSPAILRVGGTSAGFMFFDVPESHTAAACLQPTPVVLRKKTVLLLAALMKSTGNRFLIDLNIQSRIGTQWNPIDSLKLFDFVSSLGLGEIIDWELGNEPEWDTKPGQRIVQPAEVANDFLILDRVVRSYPEFSKSRIVGPDCVQVDPNSLGYNITKTTVETAGHLLHAVTFHHYYFDGKAATVKDFINATKFSNYAGAINSVKSAMSSHPTLSIWNGETSDSYNSGTPNVTDRYVSGFLWLDKLGLSARMGVGVVMRQTFHGGHYSLISDYLQPNPDYWLSLVYKQLVGTRVLDVVINGEEFSSERAADNTTEASSTRVYAHCTKLNHNPSALGGVTKSYPSGSVTIYALNVSPTTSSSLHLPAEWSKSSTDLYLLTPGEGGLVSKNVLVNGVLMKLIDDQVLPSIKPSTLQPGEYFILPPTSFGFFVIPGAKAKACL